MQKLILSEKKLCRKKAGAKQIDEEKKKNVGAKRILVKKKNCAKQIWQFFSLFSKQILVQKLSVSKLCWLQKVLVQKLVSKDFLWTKNVVPKNFFSCRTNFGAKVAGVNRCWCKKILVEFFFGSKGFIWRKKLAAENFFVFPSGKKLGQRNFGAKFCLVLKQIRYQKNVGGKQRMCQINSNSTFFVLLRKVLLVPSWPSWPPLP